MDILKIAGIGIISTIAFLIVKDTRPELAYVIAAVGGILIMILTMDYLSAIVKSINGLVGKIGLNAAIIASILKIVGVGYIAEFAASLCEDAGSKSIAEKMRFGGKVIILYLSLPILTGVIDIIASVVNGVT